MSRSSRLLTTTLFTLATSAIACSPQVDPDYSGEPLATIRGVVLANASLPSAAPDADVAVLWFSSESNECTGPVLGCGAGGGGSVDQFECVAACGPEPLECNADVLATYGACVQACGWDYFFQILWDLCVDAASGERVSVEGEFPAAFTLDLYQPPPESALITAEDGLRAAYGWFIVADPEVETVSLDLYAGSPPQGIIGGSGSHVLIYAADPIPADSPWGQFLGGTFSTGYHVLNVVKGVNCDVPDPPNPCFGTSDTYELSPDDLATEISVELAPFTSIEWPGL